MTEILSDVWRSMALLMVGFVVAAVVHEGGHALAGTLAGIRPRVVNIGVGRPWRRLKVGRTWVVLRIGVLAAGWNSHEPSDRRWALAVLVAGGPLANLLLLAILYAATLIAPASHDALEPFGFAEVAAVALTLFPARQTLNGRKVPTDGLRLYRLCIQGKTADLGSLYEKLLRPLQPVGAAPHGLTRNAPALLYVALRQDRWSETWACRDAVAGYRTLLGLPDLTAAERAYVLCDLVVQHLLLGAPGVSGNQLESWSSEAMALAATPRTGAVHGAVLVARGRLVEGKSILLDAVVGLKDRGELLSATAVQAHAAIGTASAELTGHHGPEWFDVARTICRSLAVGRAIERALARMERQVLAVEPEPESWTIRIKRWLAGADLP